jgi:hypothetical protein
MRNRRQKFVLQMIRGFGFNSRLSDLFSICIRAEPSNDFAAVAQILAMSNICFFEAASQ